jgi:hypothetical protein
MKKLLILIQLIVVAMLYSTSSYADWDDRGDGWGGHHHHHGHGWGHHRGHGYYPQPQVNNYYPQPQVNNYYPQPQTNYYPPQPQYYGYDQRSHQGLAGGVIGSVFGYELGGGDPLAAGLGAAAGSFLGNGFGMRY